MTTTVWEPSMSAEPEKWLATADRLSVEHFAPLAAEIDAAQRYPEEHLPVLRDAGLCGMFVPRAYGGSELPLETITAVAERVSVACATTSAILAALALGAYPIALGGTEEQKQRYLGALAREGRAVCFALSEPGAGSDAAAITATAEREGEGWRIRGEKCWLGNGGHSSTYVVFARTRPEDRRSITAFLVERDAEGVVVDHYEDKLGIRGTTTTNLRLDTVVSAEAILGEEGGGLGLALGTLTLGRVLIAAQANGIARAAFDEAAAFAVGRQTFGKAIIDHQGVGFQLADCATELSAARMMMFEAARAYDAGLDVKTLAPMAKLFASEVSHRVVDRCMQVLGGRGYVKPSAVERLYRDQRITEIYEGTSEIQRVVISQTIKTEQEAAAS
ncbi:Acyl-CoA dehydrogenase [Pseudonocardia ammonioxydans]|uniref:Acyl-CoA dehydrogenase n=1 Tax=Pseudonocardia ammonioxydans TaxID=260086 RepID=A0A1I5HND2_PSUAM|nr:acyl-CoA dehydrogenase family protein [Pseudonocardia ammonioxydans]SFO49416.1 Acyl-CoA dehydrogenase [Pseudonocardia ammonioxydans]